MPSPYAKDHPQADLLRLKRLVMTRPLAADGSLTDRLISAYAETLPVLRVLDSVL